MPFGNIPMTASCQTRHENDNTCLRYYLDLVGMEGFEPSRYFYRQNLNLLRATNFATSPKFFITIIFPFNCDYF